MDLGITVTQAAQAQMKSLMDSAGEGAQGLRLAIKATGCSGNSYKMEYVSADDSGAADDILTLSDGVRLYIPKVVSWMLIGMTVEHVTDALGNARFDFKNPNETGRCGCGESFQVQKP